MTQTADAEPATDYDAVAYPSLAHPLAHPEVMATLARVSGLAAVDIDACRVLELGCGDGSHLIPIAEACPNSTFVGVDLSQRAVARGRADIEALGLTNIRLEIADLLDWRPEPGAFDYAIAHGLYAWTPPAVRDATMAVLGQALAPGGMAMLSYNVAPGCNVRLMVRELVEYELRDVEDPAERARRGHAALKASLEDLNAVHPLGMALEFELRRWADFGSESLLHDILASFYTPARLPDVVAHAGRHGLSYLGDADRGNLRRAAYPSALDMRLRELSDGDPVETEHRHDLRVARAFRHSVLLKGPPHVVRTLSLAAVGKMHASLAPAIGTDADLGTEEKGEWSMTFVTPEGFEAKIAGAPAQRLVRQLKAVFPGSMPVRDLGLTEAGMEVAALLYVSGAIKLRTQPLRIGLEPGPRPAATPLARRQARLGRRVIRLDHEMMTLDPTAAKLLALLDGRRTLPEIAALLGADLGVPPPVVLAALPPNLADLAKRGLLLAP